MSIVFTRKQSLVKESQSHEKIKAQAVEIEEVGYAIVYSSLVLL